MPLPSWIPNIVVWVYQRKDGMAMEKMHVPIVRQKKNPTDHRGNCGHVLSKFTKNAINLLYYIHLGQAFCVKEASPGQQKQSKSPPSPRITLIDA